MSDDFDQRLAAAAQAVHEFEATGRRCAELRARQDEIGQELEDLRSTYATDRKDVDRLEHLSLTRVLTSLKGSRDEALSRERAEADAARYRVAQAQARLDAVRQEHQAAQERLDKLTAAPDDYAAVLTAKEQHLTESSDPRRPALLQLAEERGRLAGGLAEMNDALKAAEAARQALSGVQDKLGSASSWSTYDTFFGGGMIATSIEHQRIDEAAQAAAVADQRMALLRTELAQVDEVGQTSPLLAISAGTKFVDMWFDNIFTDLAIRDRIKQAQQNVERSLQLVSGVQSRLTSQVAQVQARLASIGTERRDLLER